MRVDNLHSLEKEDLLEIIKEQQEEIKALKFRIEALEKRVKQIEYCSFETNVHSDTKDENLKNTTDNILITNDNSQTKDNQNMQLMLLPKNNSLAILLPKFLSKIKKSKRFFRLAIIYFISFFIIVFSIFQIGRINFQKNCTIKLTDTLQSYINIKSGQDNVLLASYEVDFEELKKINSDTVGWIKVNGINISFPVVKADNNNFYLKHSFDKSNNPCGWIFADCNNKIDGTDKNIIIYGHNRRDGTMFSQLISILNPEWYNDENNKYISFITEQGEEKYEVFSIYQIEAEDYYIQTKFNSTKDYLDFLNTLKSRSTKDFQVSLSANDQVLTLSTCGKENKLRVVLHAKKIINN